MIGAHHLQLDLDRVVVVGNVAAPGTSVSRAAPPAPRVLLGHC